MIVYKDAPNWSAQDKILLLRRLGSHGEGTWSVPGGWIDRGEESIMLAALRELREETGEMMQVTNPELRGVTNDVFPDEDIHCVTFWFSAHLISGEPQLMEPDKADLLEWFPINQLPEPLFYPFVNYLEGNIVR